jgi:hypothetical protein
VVPITARTQCEGVQLFISSSFPLPRISVGNSGCGGGSSIAVGSYAACNGLQHLATMTGEENNLAIKVNLFASSI